MTVCSERSQAGDVRPLETDSRSGAHLIDPQRLAGLFEAHAASLALYARQFDGDADELVQEAFVRLMALAAVPPNPAAWLALTLRRIAIDRRRSWFRRRRRERVSASAEPFECTPGAAIDARHAAELLSSLPERQREVVVLRIWHGLSMEEIGSVVGLAKSSVSAELATALSSLRQRMENHARSNIR